VIEEGADVLSFLAFWTGLSIPEPATEYEKANVQKATFPERLLSAHQALNMGIVYQLSPEHRIGAKRGTTHEKSPKHLSELSAAGAMAMTSAAPAFASDQTGTWYQHR
jgi:hypothetical protein